MVNMNRIRRIYLPLLGLLWLVPALATAPLDREAEKEKMRELGRQNDSAWSLYQSLKQAAGGGKRLNWEQLPDWSGLYTKTRGGLKFDPDQPDDGLPTAVLTPKYHKILMDTIDRRARNIEYDPLSQCIDGGHPRWMGFPFLREHILTPDQSTFIAEAFNSVRRVYTDGRGHLPEDMRFAKHLGDSIGFWDGDKLVVHTNELMAGMYERVQPLYTEQVETVEVWRKVSDRVIEVDLWIYDPPVLAEPWYTKQSYTRLGMDNTLRLGHWACRGTQNNDVIQTEEGGSTFRDLTFTSGDDSK